MESSSAQTLRLPSGNSYWLCGSQGYGSVFPFEIIANTVCVIDVNHRNTAMLIIQPAKKGKGTLSYIKHRKHLSRRQGNVHHEDELGVYCQRSSRVPVLD